MFREGSREVTRRSRRAGLRKDLGCPPVILEFGLCYVFSCFFHMWMISLTIYAWYEFRVYDAARVSAVSLWLEEAVMSLDTCDFVLVDSTRVNVEFLDSYCSSSLPETSSRRRRDNLLYLRGPVLRLLIARGFSWMCIPWFDILYYLYYTNCISTSTILVE